MSFDNKLKAINESMLAMLSAKLIKSNQNQGLNPEQARDLKRWSDSFRRYSELLVKTSKVLDIDAKSMFDVNLVLDISQRMSESRHLFDLKRINKEIDTKIGELKALSAQMRQKYQNSREESAVDMTQIKSKIDFYQQKRREYYEKVKEHEDSLKKSGFASELGSPSMDALKENNRRLKTLLDLVNDKLDSYDFEANEQSLSDKIEDMKKELEKLNIKS